MVGAIGSGEGNEFGGIARMNERARAMIDAETPVNPYSLLEAVNRSSDSANAAWLIYVALMSYLLITVAGISHKDLLLNSDITLPILQVKIELTRFFLFAPILLVLLHLGLMGQLRAAGAQDARVRGLHPHARDHATSARIPCASSSTTSSSRRPSPAPSAAASSACSCTACRG